MAVAQYRKCCVDNVIARLKRERDRQGRVSSASIARALAVKSETERTARLLVGIMIPAGNRYRCDATPLERRVSTVDQVRFAAVPSDSSNGMDLSGEKVNLRCSRRTVWNRKYHGIAVSAPAA